MVWGYGGYGEEKQGEVDTALNWDEKMKKKHMFQIGFTWLMASREILATESQSISCEVIMPNGFIQYEIWPNPTLLKPVHQTSRHSL